MLRGWYLAEIVHAPDFTALQQDPAVQDYHARGIAFGDWKLPPGAETDPEIRTNSYFRPPGHAYFLSALYFVTGGSYLAVRIVNMALGLVAVVLMYLLGRRVFGRGVGLISAGLMSTYWGFVFWEGEVNDPCLFVFLGPLLMYVVCRWTEKMPVYLAAIAGLICGGYALMRPNILLFGPFLALWMLWVAYRRKQIKRVVFSWIALAGCTFLVIIPVTIRNYVVAHEFVPISTYFGENFLIGNGPEADGVTPWTPYLQHLEGTGNWSVWVYVNVVKGAGREMGIKNAGYSAASNYFYKQTLDYVKTHKLRTLKLALKKAVLFWTPIEITCNKVVQYEKEYYPPLKYMPGFPLVMALFLAGAALFLLDLRARRVLEGTAAAAVRPTEMSLLLFAFVALYFLSFLPFFVNGRARIPIIPFCFLLGSYGAWRVVEYARARETRRTAIWIGAFVALYALASIQYIRFEPDRSRWFYQRADSYIRIGEIDKAIAEARNLLDRPDTASYMNMRLARAFADAGRKEEAFQQFMAALTNHPNDPDVQFSGAAELIRIGRVAEGIAHYDEALRLNPNDARAHNNLGLLLADQQKFPEALAHLRDAVRIDPDYTLARINLGNLLLRIGTRDTIEEAIQNYAQAIEREPKEENCQYNLAVALAASGRVDKAIERYQKALEINPDDARAHNNLGLLLADRKQYAEATKHYEDALRIAPDFALVYANLGNLLADQGKRGEGIAMYEKGLALKPEDAGLQNGLGFLYAGKGDAENALKHYNEALRIAPDYPLALNNLGNLLAQQGKPGEAMKCYQRALAIAPADRNAYFNMAELQSQLKDYDQAIALYRKAADNDPANADIPNGLANALVRKVRFDEAIEYYKAALQLNPKHVGAHNNLGNVLAALGRTDEAAGQFRKVLEIDPGNAVAKDGLQKIEGTLK